MDEKKAMPMPPKRKMFGEEMGKEEMMKETPMPDFCSAFATDDGKKAANFINIELDEDGKFLAEVPMTELEDYAMKVLDGGEDDRGLMVGDFFEGETALDDALAEADMVNAECAPEMGDDDMEKADCAREAHAGEYMKEEEKGMEDIGAEPMLDQFPME